jgi:hypothetical protein
MIILPIKANVSLGEEIAALRSNSYCGFCFAAILADGSWSPGSGPDLSPGGGVSERTGKSVEQLAIVCAQLPMPRCYASLGITLGLKKYSHYENTLSGISYGLASGVCTFFSSVGE